MRSTRRRPHATTHPTSTSRVGPPGRTPPPRPPRSSAPIRRAARRRVLPRLGMETGTAPPTTSPIPSRRRGSVAGPSWSSTSGSTTPRSASSAAGGCASRECVPPRATTTRSDRNSRRAGPAVGARSADPRGDGGLGRSGLSGLGRSERSLVPALSSRGVDPPRARPLGRRMGPRSVVRRGGCRGRSRHRSGRRSRRRSEECGSSGGSACGDAALSRSDAHEDCPRGGVFAAMGWVQGPRGVLIAAAQAPITPAGVVGGPARKRVGDPPLLRGPRELPSLTSTLNPTASWIENAYRYNAGRGGACGGSGIGRSGRSSSRSLPALDLDAPALSRDPASASGAVPPHQRQGSRRAHFLTLDGPPRGRKIEPS